MAEIINQASVIRESVVGEPIRTMKAESRTVVRDIVFGEPPQPPPLFEVPVVVREVVIYDSNGSPPYLMQMVRETLTSNPVVPPGPVDQVSVVREFVTGEYQEPDFAAKAAFAVREALIRDVPFKVPTVVREALVNKVEPVTLQRVATGLRQYSVMLRPPMVKPSTVKSPNMQYQLREIVTQKRVPPPLPRSEIVATKLNRQIAIKRPPALEENMRSPIRMGRLAWSIAMSRTRVYAPVSEVVMAVARRQVVQARTVTPAPQVRTPITMPTVVEQVVQSRVGKAVSIVTDAFVRTMRAQVVQQIPAKAYRSKMDAGKLLYQVVQVRNVTPPGIDDRVAAVAQAITVSRSTSIPRGQDISSALRELVTQQRGNIAPPFGNELARVLKNLVVTKRDTVAPAFMVGRHTKSLRMQFVQQDVVQPPATYRSSIPVASYVRASVHEIKLPMHHSTTAVRLLTLAFVYGKKFPLPWDVIDPAIGRHVANMNVLVLQHRDTISPGQIDRESRYLYSIATEVMLGDVFPPPDMPPPVVPETYVNQVFAAVIHRDMDDWIPVSGATVQSMGESVVVGDEGDWIDPTIPQSPVSVQRVGQALALSDTFPDSMMAQSAAMVAGMTEAVAVVDSTMPDPSVPASEIQGSLVAEIAVVGDAQFPDPTIPLSDVRSSLVASSVAVRDPSLTDVFGMSDIEVPTLLEFLLIRDPTLVGIPLRQGARPIITVSMS